MSMSEKWVKWERSVFSDTITETLKLFKTGLIKSNSLQAICKYSLSLCPQRKINLILYTRWIWWALQPSLVLCCWEIWRRVAVGRNGVLPFCLGAVEHFPFICAELDSPDAEGETVPTVRRSESVLGFCTLPCPSPQTTVLELLPLHSKGKGFERLKYPAERQWNCTEKQLSRCSLIMFFHSVHEHLLLEEIVWAAPCGVGQSSCAQHGLQC